MSLPWVFYQTCLGQVQDAPFCAYWTVRVFFENLQVFGVYLLFWALVALPAIGLWRRIRRTS